MIARLLADVCGKGSKGTRVTCFQFAKGIQVTCCCRIIKLLYLQRLKRLERLRFASEDQIANRSATEIPNFVCESCANANASTELFVGLFEASGNVNRITIRGVVEKTAATKIPHNCWSGVDANARGPECDPLLMTALAENLGVPV